MSVRAVVVAGAAAVTCLCACGALAQQKQIVKREPVSPYAFQDIARDNAAMVVTVTQNDDTEPAHLCTGVIVGAGGEALCVMRPRELRRTQPGQAVTMRSPGGDWPAAVRAIDPEKGVVLVAPMENRQVRVPRLGLDVHVAPGQWVVAVGTVDAQPHAAAGLVLDAPKAIRRAPSGEFVHEAPADAGTALFDLSGRLVGLSLPPLSARKGRGIELRVAWTRVAKFLHDLPATPSPVTIAP